MATVTFFPSLDGIVKHDQKLGWAALIAAAGTAASDALSSLFNTFAYSSTPNKWNWLDRIIIIFDTSSIPDGATIQSATLSIYGSTKIDHASNTPDINVYSANPASQTALAAGDYDSLGSTPYCDTAITYANWNLSGYNDFVLNATGLAAISKTGKSVFGLRNAKHDVAAAAPTWAMPGSGGLEGYSRRNDDAYKPKLVVTYLTAVLVTTDAATNVTTTTATLNGTLDADGGAACTCSFDYGETIAYGSAAAASGTYTTGQSFSKGITGLKPGTTYHFRAKGDNGSDVGYGDDLTFTTLGLAYPTEAISRVSALIHRYSAGDRSYTLEVLIGGLSSAYGLPTSSKDPLPSIRPEVPRCGPGEVPVFIRGRYVCIPVEFPLGEV